MDEQNINNPNVRTGQPRLKKVKRPIRRVMPQSEQNATLTQANNSGLSAPAFSSSASTGTPVSSNPFDAFDETNFSDNTTVEEDFNVDEYLDTDENLPSVTGNNYNPQADNQQFITDEYINNNAGVKPFSINGEIISKNTLIILGAVLFFAGFLIAKLFFAEEKVVRDGLQGVVINSEVPRGRARCGTTEKTQGCVLYIMNPQRQELFARDFYDLASQLTGRQRFVIETGNMRYSNTKIRPGELGQFNIPPLQ